MSDGMYRVLVVEDEPFIRQDIVNEIEEADMGYEVKWTANNGEDALKIIEKENPDLIFTDIKMPVMSGMELIERVREKNIQTSIVLLTGFAEFDYARQAIRLGVEDYLLKPLETENLRKILEEIRCKLQKKEKKFLESELYRIGGSQSLPFQYENEWMNMYLIRIGRPYYFEPSKGMQEHIENYWINHNLEKCIEQLCKEQVYWLIEERKPNQKFLLIKDVEARNIEEYVKFAEILRKELSACLKNIPVYIAVSGRGISYREIGDYSEKLRMLMESENEESKVFIWENERKEDLKVNHERLVKEIEFYIRNHYMENITISHLSEKFHFSRNYLTKVFKNNIGDTLGNYLIQVRLEKAIELMQSREDLEIQTISNLVGYKDSHYFSRIFKNKMGITPTEFRNQKVKKSHIMA